MTLLLLLRPPGSEKAERRSACREDAQLSSEAPTRKGQPGGLHDHWQQCVLPFMPRPLGLGTPKPTGVEGLGLRVVEGREPACRNWCSGWMDLPPVRVQILVAFLTIEDS